MSEQPTCGEGLAANAAIPAKMAQFLDSLADTLDSHIEALVPGDDKAALERRAYVSLVQQCRDAGSRPRRSGDGRIQGFAHGRARRASP